MALIFVFLLAVALAEIVILVQLAQQEPLDLIGQAMHPFNVIGFLFLVTLIDFVSLFEIVAGGEKAEFAGSMISYSSDVVKGMLFYVACQTAVVAGLWLASAQVGTRARAQIRYRMGQPVVSTPAELSAARVCIFISVVAAVIAGRSMVIVALQHGSLGYIAGVRQRFFADNPAVQIVVTTVAPAFILFGSRDKFKSLILVLPILVAFLALVGGRSKLLYPMVALAYWFCRSRKMSVVWVYLMMPVLIVALVAFSYYSRYSGSYTSFQQYLDANGGMFGALFDEPSISMAEAITINVTDPILHRMPWDSIVGALTLPLPRSVFQWKPYGVSTDFSMTADYSRFMAVKSEWTVTGFIDCFYSFGYIGGIFACGAIAYYWARMLIRSATGRRGTAFMGPIAIMIAYQFVRGDLYIVSQFLWPTGVVLLIYSGFRAVFRLLPGAAPKKKRRLLARRALVSPAGSVDAS